MLLLLLLLLLLLIELLYGGFWEESHLRGQESPHSLSQHRFAFSFLFKPTPDNFHQLRACLDTLEGVWPLKRLSTRIFTKHFYYESDLSLSDFAPLLSLYSIVFLYITFSVGKHHYQCYYYYYYCCCCCCCYCCCCYCY